MRCASRRQTFGAKRGKSHGAVAPGGRSGPRRQIVVGDLRTPDRLGRGRGRFLTLLRLVDVGAAQRFLRRIGFALAAPQPRVYFTAREELVMRAAFGDDALVEHEDLVGV